MACRWSIVCLLALPAVSRTAADTATDPIELARERLRAIMPERQKVDDFIKPRPANAAARASYGWTYDSELGWRLYDGVRFDGINRSKTFYHYEPDGARLVVNSAGKPCRIHT